MPISLLRLRYFHAIVTEGSLSAAARQLNVAQPALSYHLAAIEQELGTTLLYRNNRGVSVTPSGALLLQRSEEILQLLGETEDEIRQRARLPHGTVTIALAVTMAYQLVPPLLRIIGRDYPLLQLRIMDVLSVRAMELMREGRLDVALVPNAADMDGCETIAAYVEGLCLIERATGDRTQARPCPFAELATYPLVLPRRGYDLRRRLEEAAIETGHSLNVRYEQDSHEIIRSIVLSGLAATVTQEAVFDTVFERPRLEIRPIVEPRIVRTHSIVRRLDRAKSIAVDAVVGALKASLTELVESGALPGRLV